MTNSNNFKKYINSIPNVSLQKIENTVENSYWNVVIRIKNNSRFININPEDALEKTNKRFIKRFQFLEKQISADGKQLSDLTFDEMNSYWDLAKKDLS